ncbi:hypothetical protein [Brevibacillus fortis]|uniref:hypothetical protein n=1 Tax=Brevibacillus fortis TaxID=2126352 RepID=UPI0038FC98EC
MGSYRTKFLNNMLKRVFRAQILGKQFAIPLHYYKFKLNKIGLIEFLGDLKELVHPLDFLIHNHKENSLLQMHWEGVWEDFSGGGIVGQWDSHYRRKSPYHINIKKYLLKNE